MNYSKLVKALRCKRDDCDGCDLAFLDNDEGWMCRYAAKDDDAADAIEELSANVADKDYQIREQWDEIQRLRRDVKKQHEKMIELAKARELKEMEAVKTWCHQRGIAMVDWPIYQSMVACYGREPKRGKWIDTVTAGIEETVCSVCRCSGFHHLKYCPNCGAEMERADEV